MTVISIMVILIATAMFLALCSADCARLRSCSWLRPAFAHACATTLTPHGNIGVPDTFEEEEDGRKTRKNDYNDDNNQILNCFRASAEPVDVEPVHFPGREGFQIEPIWMIDQKPNLLVGAALCSTDEKVDCKTRYSDAKKRDALYSWLYDAFDTAGSFENAARLKAELLRDIKGGKKIIERAFREVTKAAQYAASTNGQSEHGDVVCNDTVFAIANQGQGMDEKTKECDESAESYPPSNGGGDEAKVTDPVHQKFVAIFATCMNRKTGLPLKMALMSRYPGHRGPISRAYKEVFDSKTA